MKRGIFTVIFIVLGAISALSSTCIAIVSGNWEASATWSCGHVPTCGDSMVIPATFTVTVTAVNNYQTGCGSPRMELTIFGELSFVTGKKLEFPCGSAVYVEKGSVIDPGGGGGSSNLISICGTNYWTAGSGPLSGPACFNCVLPIQLATFSASCGSNSINLSWSTETETNNKYFTIERCDDGINWAQIATINGAGNATTPRNYSWADLEPLPGTSYYRLKQTDFDGNYTYPGLTSISCNSNGFVSLYPNPSKGNVFFKVRSSSVQDVSITVIDELGQRLTTYNDNLEQGFNDKQLQVKNLNPGVYIAIITFADQSVIRKPFVVAN